MIDQRLFKNEEKAIFSLRSLYRKYGYLSFKMSKFEEYELYIRNKDFLVSDRVITFNDTNGRLLALKPDVTLSIIKNGEDSDGFKQKVCYNENVYRVSDSTGQYKEIMQTGLECIGDTDMYDIYEVISLAAMSLALISDSFVLEISHLGIISELLDEISTDKLFAKRALGFIAEKNSHDLQSLCSEYGVSADETGKLMSLISVYGERRNVIKRLEEAGISSAGLKELKELSAMLDLSPQSEKITFDFSVVNDMGYYNGFVFKGFLRGICAGVLAGGQYDKLMKKMGRTANAVGFALYLDMLEQLSSDIGEYDVDILLVYGDDDDKAAVAAKVKELTDNGFSVSAQKSGSGNLRRRQTVKFKAEEKIC